MSALDSRLSRVENFMQQLDEETNYRLPKYSKSLEEWSLEAKQITEGRKNIIAYLPFMQRYMEDQHPSKQTLFPSHRKAR